MWPKIALPYLEAVEDDVHGDDPYWTLEKSLDEIRAALARAGVRGGRLEDVVVEARTASGRVGRVGLPGLDPASMNSNDFRLALGSTELRSTAFTLARSGDRVTFTGRGYGHGVGMCVIGAGRRAARGESAAQILARYYPGLALEDVSRVRSGVAPRETSALPAPPASPPAKPAAPPAPPTAQPSAFVRALVPAGSRTTAADLERMAGEAQAKIAQRLGVDDARAHHPAARLDRHLPARHRPAVVGECDGPGPGDRSGAGGRPRAARRARSRRGPRGRRGAGRSRAERSPRLGPAWAPRATSPAASVRPRGASGVRPTRI